MSENQTAVFTGEKYTKAASTPCSHHLPKTTGPSEVLSIGLEDTIPPSFAVTHSPGHLPQFTEDSIPLDHCLSLHHYPYHDAW